MTIVSLATYLKMYRKRSCLTHEEVAFLIGVKQGSTVSRHETGGRLPSLQAAIAYEMIFGVPVGEMYVGVFADAMELLRERARGLRLSLEKLPPSALRDRKLEALTQIIGVEGGELAA